MITVAEHERRVTELLHANNQLLERARIAEGKVIELENIEQRAWELSERIIRVLRPDMSDPEVKNEQVGLADQLLLFAEGNG